MLVTMQCLVSPTEFNFLPDIVSSGICNSMALQHTGKKGSALKNATGVKMKQVNTGSQLLEAKAVWNGGRRARISILLTCLPPSLITMQALSVSVESLYYFQVSPIVSHCDKVQDDLTQWWITPDIEFSLGCQRISVGCVTWKCHKTQIVLCFRTKPEFGTNSTDSGHKQGSLEGWLGFLLFRRSLCFSGVKEITRFIKMSCMQNVRMCCLGF